MTDGSEDELILVLTAKWGRANQYRTSTFPHLKVRQMGGGGGGGGGGICQIQVNAAMFLARIGNTTTQAGKGDINAEALNNTIRNFTIKFRH